MTKKIIFWVVIAGALIAAWYFLYYKPNQKPAEGSLCNGGYGKITNGVCVGCGYYSSRTATGNTVPIPKPC